MSSLSLSPGLPNFDIGRIGEPLPVASWAEPKEAWYYMVMKTEEAITEFHVCNYSGPQTVESLGSDGKMHPWESRTVGDELVFYAPDSYRGGQVGWAYDKRLQRGVRMPSEELLKRAFRMRKSVSLGE